MKLLKVLFLLSLVISFLTSGVNAAPKRVLSEEPKNKRSVLTTAEQTELNREQEERVVTSNAVEKEDIVRSSSKRARSEIMTQIAESSFQESSEASSETAVQASSNSAVDLAEPTRFLWTQKIPTLYRFALEKLMRLPANHPIFEEGLPLQLHMEFIEPYYNSMCRMIQDLHESCQQYDLYRLSEEDQKKERLIIFKQQLQRLLAHCDEHLSKKNYPQALFRMDTMRVVFPEFRIAINSLKEEEALKKETRLALQKNDQVKVRLLHVLMQFVVQQTKHICEIAKEKQYMNATVILSTPFSSEVEFLKKRLDYRETKVTRVASLIEQQKIFLLQSEQLTPEQKENMAEISWGSLAILNSLDSALDLKDQEKSQLLSQQLNSYDQMMKALASTDSRVQSMQKEILKINTILVSLASCILEGKMQQREITSIRQQRLTTLKSGTLKVQGEFYAPIFDLYEIPLGFLEKEIALLEEAKMNLLAGKKELCFYKKGLAEEWKIFAMKAARDINVLSQLGMVVSSEKFLETTLLGGQATFRDQEEWLIAREAELAVQASSLPVDQRIALLPWTFEKTFEENVEALPRIEGESIW